MHVLDASQTRPLTGGASFSTGNRIFRVAWSLAWLLFARFTPPPLFAWRRIVLRAFGAKVGRGARVYASVSIWFPRNLELGENCKIGPGVRLYNQGFITVGDYSVISQRAHICASTHAVNDPDFQLLLRPVTIGNRCWVAAEAFVGPGVTMGDRSVLAARGALFRNAGDDEIFSGNPACLLKIRNLEAIHQYAPPSGLSKSH